MTVTAGQVTLDTTAGGVEVYTNDTGSVRKIVVHVPTGGQSVFLGPSGVATTTGLEVEAGTDMTQMQLLPGDALYGIVAATTQAVSYMVI